MKIQCMRLSIDSLVVLGQHEVGDERALDPRELVPDVGSGEKTALDCCGEFLLSVSGDLAVATEL